MDDLRKEVNEILNAFADKIVHLALLHSNRMTVVRLREARARMRGKNGDGTIPFGEHPAYPREKEALQFMIKARKNGHPYRTIAEMLEREGHATRTRGGMWNPGSVLRILKRNGIG